MQSSASKKRSKFELLLWGIAFPGFGQLLSGSYIKGILLVLLEIIINVQAHFNRIIILSFNGNIHEAVTQANYDWLLFYPCVYFFAIWDAFKDGSGPERPFMFLPFVFSAYLVTVGVFFSKSFTIHGVLLGPVWLPMLCLPIGLAIGFTIRAFCLLSQHKKT